MKYLDLGHLILLNVPGNFHSNIFLKCQNVKAGDNRLPTTGLSGKASIQGFSQVLVNVDLFYKIYNNENKFENIVSIICLFQLCN